MFLASNLLPQFELSSEHQASQTVRIRHGTCEARAFCWEFNGQQSLNRPELATVYLFEVQAPALPGDRRKL